MSCQLSARPWPLTLQPKRERLHILLPFHLTCAYVILIFSLPTPYLLFTSSPAPFSCYPFPRPAPVSHFSSPVRPFTKIQRRPLRARVLLPSPRLHTSKWFAEPGATHSQWTGLLLTAVETYNMPGNRGNHSRGDGTRGNWHSSSHSFGECDVWPSSLISL